MDERRIKALTGLLRPGQVYLGAKRVADGVEWVFSRVKEAEYNLITFVDDGRLDFGNVGFPEAYLNPKWNWLWEEGHITRVGRFSGYDRIAMAELASLRAERDDEV